MGGENEDLGDLYVCRCGCGEENAVGDVSTRKGLNAFIYVVGAFFVAVEADDGEVGFDESGFDGSDTNGSVCEVHT